MKSHHLHETANRIARARNLTTREALSLLSKRGAAERARQRKAAQAEPTGRPQGQWWWQRELYEDRAQNFRTKLKT